MWARSLMDTEVIVVSSTHLTSPGNAALFVRPHGLLGWWVGGREAVGWTLGGTVKCFHCRKRLCVSFGRSPVSPLSPPELEASIAVIHSHWNGEDRLPARCASGSPPPPQPHSLPFSVCFRPLWLEISASLSPSSGSPLLPLPLPAVPVLIHTVVICLLT